MDDLVVFDGESEELLQYFIAMVHASRDEKTGNRLVDFLGSSNDGDVRCFKKFVACGIVPREVSVSLTRFYREKNNL